MKPRRQFIDGQYGQIHVRVSTPESASHRPLACLHMSPKSGRIFSRFMAAAAADRLVMAHDYPGFGESAPPPAEPHVSIEDYAQSLWDTADALGLQNLDLLGYHTGSEVAVEAARQQPDRVGSIVLISAPVFTEAEIRHMHETYSEIPLDEHGTRFRKMWEAVLAHRGPGTTLEGLAESFAENLRAGEFYEWGHRAAFNYAPKFTQTVSQLPHKITILNPDDDLAVFTPRIKPYLQNGEIIDCPGWGHGFFDAFTQDAVSVIKTALEEKN